MTNDLIVLKQLPVIEEQLKQVRDSVKERVGEALALVCTDDTYKIVKQHRAALRKEYSELEARRISIKKEILAPYEQFERTYKECVGDIYANADTELKRRIDEVESGLKTERTEDVKTYFAEYRQCLGIASDLVSFEDAGIVVHLNDSKKALRQSAKDFLDRINSDLALIDTQDNPAEILVEYRKTLNASKAITTVIERRRAVEMEKQRKEETEKQAEARDNVASEVEQIAALASPAVTTAPPEEDPPEPVSVYTVEFRVTGTIDDLKILKRFLTEGGFYYEQL